MINLFQPSAGTDELSAVEAVFASSWLGEGERVLAFERAFADFIGRPSGEVQAVASCTEGLFQAVAALGIGPGDEVILPSISFIGAAHAAASTGAQVVLCDVDPQTLNPSVDQVSEVLTPATTAVIVLHYGGEAGDLLAIARLLKERSVALIEDAAIGLGSFVGGRACGTFGEIGVWSFDAMKVLTTGDGGMVWCRGAETAERIRASVRLGVGPSGFNRRSHTTRWWEIDPLTAGRRATMNDIAAAIGISQFARAHDFLRRRAEIADRYDQALSGISWLSLTRRSAVGQARTFYWVQTSPHLRDRLAAHMLEHGVYTTFRYWPLHRTRMYGSSRTYPGADSATDSTLLLPLHHGLSDRDVDFVVESIATFPGAAQ